VGEEWRLVIEFDADGALAPAAEEIVAELGSEIGLHRAGDSLVAYADTPEAAHAAERRLRGELEKRGLAHLESGVQHWSHGDQEWQDGAGDPAEADDDAADEEDEVEEDDTAEEPSAADAWTVAVSLSHHREAKQLAEQLRNEGWDVSSSWHTLEVSTRGREEAETLVAELELRAPDADVAIAE
jgi:hypothetical protein